MTSPAPVCGFGCWRTPRCAKGPRARWQRRRSSCSNASRPHASPGVGPPPCWRVRSAPRSNRGPYPLPLRPRRDYYSPRLHHRGRLPLWQQRQDPLPLPPRHPRPRWRSHLPLPFQRGGYHPPPPTRGRHDGPPLGWRHRSPSPLLRRRGGATPGRDWRRGHRHPWHPPYHPRAGVGPATPLLQSPPRNLFLSATGQTPSHPSRPTSRERRRPSRRLRRRSGK